MSKPSRYTVDAPLVAVPHDGRTRFYYRGDKLPAVDEALRARLLEHRLIKPVSAAQTTPDEG